ncbi:MULTISPECIES: DoxX family protein [Vibrio]|jgi:putative oxidoreductase|uniref:DoxX family protein n=1 Tax=Vibrio TaxID=662 RepID=UPI001EFDCD7B|nr:MULTISPECIES: DoxX family protein [Vibrio]MCG9561845.1 DoxX family protein [Vibrio chagasii]CAH6876113.1 DoxX family protein [Vibrio chagasii]CAH6938341.1 DoxX family protein [Vibrio chagasii]CAH6966674.1 DoxX family protein [Vibrio chagasii]CAH6974076.1 DoxX family protein [Vibrio chagasii]
MNKLQQFSAPAGRLFLALIFVMSGFSKIGQYEQTQGYMEMMGVPGALLPLVILTEVIAGLAIVLGWKTKVAAFALAGFSVMSAILFHADFSNPAEMTNFMKNISLAGAFLILFSQGAGAYSLDNRQK